MLNKILFILYICSLIKCEEIILNSNFYKNKQLIDPLYTVTIKYGKPLQKGIFCVDFEENNTIVLFQHDIETSSTYDFDHNTEIFYIGKKKMILPFELNYLKKEKCIIGNGILGLSKKSILWNFWVFLTIRSGSLVFHNEENYYNKFNEITSHNGYEINCINDILHPCIINSIYHDKNTSIKLSFNSHTIIPENDFINDISYNSLENIKLNLNNEYNMKLSGDCISEYHSTIESSPNLDKIILGMNHLKNYVVTFNRFKEVAIIKQLNLNEHYTAENLFFYSLLTTLIVRRKHIKTVPFIRIYKEKSHPVIYLLDFIIWIISIVSSFTSLWIDSSFNGLRLDFPIFYWIYFAFIIVMIILNISFLIFYIASKKLKKTYKIRNYFFIMLYSIHSTMLYLSLTLILSQRRQDTISPTFILVSIFLMFYNNSYQIIWFIFDFIRILIMKKNKILFYDRLYILFIILFAIFEIGNIATNYYFLLIPSFKKMYGGSLDILQLVVISIIFYALIISISLYIFFVYLKFHSREFILIKSKEN